MSIMDNLLVFSSAQALTTTAASTSIVDLTGAGSGNAPNLVWGTSTVFGEDIGIGSGTGSPRLRIDLVVVPAGGTSINFQFQGAPDNGSNAPGTYVTYAETGAILTADFSADKRVWDIAVPNREIAAAMPRFLRVNYTIVGTYSTGTVNAFIYLGGQNADNMQYPHNYTGPIG